MAGKSIGDWTDVTSIGRNEIVFEGRFKDYGAYFVRTRYRKTLLVAFGISVLISVVAISLPVILRALEANKKGDETVTKVVAHFTAPPPPAKTPPPPPPPPPPKQLVNQLKVTPPVVSKTDIDTIKTVHEEEHTNVALNNQKGKDTIIVPINTGNQVIGDQNDNQILTVVQQMPKPPFELAKYLSEHIQYPEAEKEEGIAGIVYLTFVVEKDGSITDVKILRGVAGGTALNNEAIRVVKGMPKWNVGMQNGHPCRVQFNLPIHFELR